MANNKIVFGEEVLLDLTGDTVTPDRLADGYTAHDRSGEPIVGTMTPNKPVDVASNDAMTAIAARATENDLGKIYLFVGEDDGVYEKDALYVLVEKGSGYGFQRYAIGGSGEAGEDLTEVLDMQSQLIAELKTKLENGGSGGGSLEGFHEVRFFNDDRTTLLYTVYVATGTSAIYAGETPVSTDNGTYIFDGFEPAANNVTSDMDCYAVYVPFGSLNDATWEEISAISAAGTGENYFAVGDTKTIHLDGKIGYDTIEGDYAVYIIGFNHNAELEGAGITFGTFKTTDGTDVAITAKNYYGQTSGASSHKMNSSNRNSGGWENSLMRSSNTGSYSEGVISYSVKDLLPDDLVAVMKPMTIYTDNTGGSSTAEANVTATVDYLPLLSPFEVYGDVGSANTYEANKQKQYAYFSMGNSKSKRTIHNTNYAASWWFRSPNRAASNSFCLYNGTNGVAQADCNYGVAPIFRV